MLAIKGVALI